MSDPFDLTGRVAVVTGGAGLLGRRHCEALARAGATVVIADVDGDGAQAAAAEVAQSHRTQALGVATDITRAADVERLLAEVLDTFGRVDVLINNAANNPQVAPDAASSWARLEHFPLEQWQADLDVGLTGAFLCSRTIGAELARRGAGVILNVASDLAVIAPDQRLYRQEGLPEEEQPVKPVSYTVVKTALLGLTRYLATYWAGAGVRVNALSPGGVQTDQPAEFVERLSRLVPLGRMAAADEYEGVVLFLCSDASSYMTGQNVVVDGGRSVW
jgi:NAD(P)-dependent dehydrogenase (short-subunit alcohol dehydrogenase family)